MIGQPTVDGVPHQRDRIVGSETVDVEHREAVERRALHVLPPGEQHRDPLCAEAAAGEGERIERVSIHPLDVVDNAEQRGPRGGAIQDRKRGQADCEPIGCLRGIAGPERRVHGVALALRQLVDDVGERQQQPVEPGIRELHLGLDPIEASDGEFGLGRDRVGQEGGLAHARLAPDHQRVAATSARVVEHCSEALSFARPAEQLHGRTLLLLLRGRSIRRMAPEMAVAVSRRRRRAPCQDGRSTFARRSAGRCSRTSRVPRPACAARSLGP